VSRLRLDEQRDVRAVGERQLRTGDRMHAEVLRSVRELQRSVQPVVVGERERGIAELGGTDGELLRQRRTVEERVRGVRVQLDVRNLPPRWGNLPVPPDPFHCDGFAATPLRALLT